MRKPMFVLHFERLPGGLGRKTWRELCGNYIYLQHFQGLAGGLEIKIWRELCENHMFLQHVEGWLRLGDRGICHQAPERNPWGGVGDGASFLVFWN